jgi:hypothetical protein
VLREIYRISLEDGSVLNVATGKKVEKQDDASNPAHPGLLG